MDLIKRVDTKSFSSSHRNICVKPYKWENLSHPPVFLPESPVSVSLAAVIGSLALDTTVFATVPSAISYSSARGVCGISTKTAGSRDRSSSSSFRF